jgi:hypothetical protein
LEGGCDEVGIGLHAGYRVFGMRGKPRTAGDVL